MPTVARADALQGSIRSPVFYRAPDRKEVAETSDLELQQDTVYIKGNSNHNHNQPGQCVGTDQL